MPTRLDSPRYLADRHEWFPDIDKPRTTRRVVVDDNVSPVRVWKLHLWA